MSNEDRIRQIIGDAVRGSIQPAVNASREIAAEFVTIPKAALPGVKRSEHDEHTYYTDGENVVYTSEDNAKMWCLRDIAVWEFIKHEGEATVMRRDELARELVNDGAYAYRFAEDPLKLAIDRIIELESA